MRRYTRRLFSQAISGAIVSLPIVNSLLRGDEPPRPLITARMCVYAQSLVNGKIVKSDIFCQDFDPSDCATAYLYLDGQATADIRAKYPSGVLLGVLVEENVGCPDVVIDPKPEGSVALSPVGKRM